MRTLFSFLEKVNNKFDILLFHEILGAKSTLVFFFKSYLTK